MRKEKHQRFKSLMVIALLTFIISTTFAQSAEDTTDGGFHDELLNNFVGKWEAAATVHKEKFTLNFEVKWVLNHQYLRVHFKSNEVIPWLKVPFESESFFGFDKMKGRYTFHELTVHGDSGPFEEALSSAYRTGNEFRLVKKQADSDMTIVQRFTWEPASKTWKIVSRLLSAGKEGEPFLEMSLLQKK